MSSKLQATQNILLTPKWKQRTYDTHRKHLKLYENNHFKLAFIGDSMMERWLNTGKNFWTKSFAECVNFGVGGDGVEHLLYRMTNNSEFKGILDIITVDKIIFMIGTNNLEKRTTNEILEGIVNIIKLIFTKQPNVEIVVYGLLDRTDISLEKIAELNAKLENFINKLNNPKLTYRFFGEKVNHEDKYFDDNVHLSQLGYEMWYNDLKELLKL